MAVNQPTTKRTAEQAERLAQVIALRRQRLSFDEVGRILGVSAQRAHQLHAEALRQIPAGELALHRREESELADRAIGNLLPIAEDPTQDPRVRIAAWVAVRAWSEVKIKLFGLANPPRHLVEEPTLADLDRNLMRAIGIPDDE